MVNTILWLACLTIIAYFKTSAEMEGAYGLAITITMLMTTLLLYQYLRARHAPTLIALGTLIFFSAIETVFFISSAVKFLHGGYVTAMIAFVILAIMYVWQYGGRIRDDNTYRAEMASLFAYKKQLSELRSDPEYPTYTTNLVYMTQIADDHYIKKKSCTPSWINDQSAPVSTGLSPLTSRMSHTRRNIQLIRMALIIWSTSSCIWAFGWSSRSMFSSARL